MGKKELRAKQKEVELVMKEIEHLFTNWEKRNADPVVAMSIMLVKAAAFSGEIFDDDKDYRMFLHKCITQGIEVYNEIREEEESKGSKYVH